MRSPLTRRGLAALMAATPAHAEAPAHEHPLVPPGKERVAFLIYPGFTALDVFGPHNMLAGLMPARLDLVAASREPVRSDTGVSVLPTASFADIEPGLDVLCLPGGTQGTLAAMRDTATLDFVARHGAAARYATSVCTGALILGAAGLLRGKRATAHWLVRDLLEIFGATPVAARVVEDGQIVTGGGVTAGIDFGLTLVGRLRNEAYAQMVQLCAEYDPLPPYDAGSPERAPADILAATQAMFQPFHAEARAACLAAARRPQPSSPIGAPP